jgi:DNA polymerase III subunit epsilon
MKQKILWFDTETTGLEKSTHGIIQIAALMEVDGVVIDEINILMQPQKGAMVSKDALNINGRTMEEIRGFMEHDTGYSLFMAFLNKHINKFDKDDKFHPAGYNIDFGIDFIQAMVKRYSKYGIGTYCNWKKLDGLGLVRILEQQGKIPLLNDNKLQTVCAYLNIPLKAHDALEDIKATRLVYNTLVKEHLK